MIRDAELAAWLLDAVEPDRAAVISAAVAADGRLRARAASLRAAMAGWTVDETPAARGWSVPPPWVRLPLGRGAEVRLLSLLGALRPGERFAVRIEHPPADARLVVLYRRDEWEVVFPTSCEDELRVADLPTEPDGSRRVELSAGALSGDQQWALVFAPPVPAIAWEAPEEERWAGLAEAVRDGRADAVSVRVTVR